MWVAMDRVMLSCEPALNGQLGRALEVWGSSITMDPGGILGGKSKRESRGQKYHGVK